MPYCLQNGLDDSEWKIDFHKRLVYFPHHHVRGTNQFQSQLRWRKGGGLWCRDSFSEGHYHMEGFWYPHRYPNLLLTDSLIFKEGETISSQLMTWESLGILDNNLLGQTFCCHWMRSEGSTFLPSCSRLFWLSHVPSIISIRLRRFAMWKWWEQSISLEPHIVLSWKSLIFKGKSTLS